MLFYLDEIAAVALAEIAFVDAGGGRVPGGAVLAVVQVLGFGDLVDGLALADGVERSQLEGFRTVGLDGRQAADADGGAAVASHGILIANDIRKFLDQNQVSKSIKI